MCIVWMWRLESREDAQALYLGFVFLYSDNCPVVRPVKAENYLTNKQKFKVTMKDFPSNEIFRCLPHNDSSCWSFISCSVLSYGREYVLVNGKLMVMFDKKPSGGYRTKGRDRDGVMTRAVPGGRARRPSFVIHNIRFCLEWGLSSERTRDAANRAVSHAACPRSSMAPVSCNRER